jgi:hypothetical protein
MGEGLRLPRFLFFVCVCVRLGAGALLGAGRSMEAKGLGEAPERLRGRRSGRRALLRRGGGMTLSVFEPPIFFLIL